MSDRLRALVQKWREEADKVGIFSARSAVVIAECAMSRMRAAARQQGAEEGKLDILAHEIAIWQDATFPTKTPHSVATHLLKEAQELHAQPTDAEEIADVFMLCVGAAHVNGIDLAAVVSAKFAKNKARTWGTPDADGVVEHHTGAPHV